MTRPSGLAAALFCLLLAPAAQAAPVHDARMDALAQRLFPLLATPAVWATPDGVAAAMLAERTRRMAACGAAPACLIPAASWSDQDRRLLARAVAGRAQAGPPPQPFSAHTSERPTPVVMLSRPPRGRIEARPRGGRATGLAACVLRYERLRRSTQDDGRCAPLETSADGLAAAVERELKGLNHILEVYGLGQAPAYPEIDGPDPAAGAPVAARTVGVAIALAEAARADAPAGRDPSVDLALALLDAFDRNDAAAFEPLEAGANAAASARAKRLEWARYRFTALIVPGAGPDDLATPLSAAGKLRSRLAAARFFDGDAPFILVTGGAVHPRGTTHVEAVEMRRALIERFGVPADRVVLEPYARHTTTNLRNATRRLAALGAPLDRDALIVTDPAQSLYIQSPVFAARNEKELGYQPGAVGPRLSPTALVFRPSRAALRVDPMDPLDP